MEKRKQALFHRVDKLKVVEYIKKLKLQAFTEEAKRTGKSAEDIRETAENVGKLA